MIGCAAKADKPEAKIANLPAPVVETSKVRCPVTSPADIAEGRRRVKRPGTGDLTVGEWQAWIDLHEAGELQKSRVISRLASEYNKCRLGG